MMQRSRNHLNWIIIYLSLSTSLTHVAVYYTHINLFYIKIYKTLAIACNNVRLIINFERKKNKSRRKHMTHVANVLINIKYIIFFSHKMIHSLEKVKTKYINDSWSSRKQAFSAQPLICFPFFCFCLFPFVKLKHALCVVHHFYMGFINI